MSPPKPTDSGRESAAGQCASKSQALPGSLQHGDSLQKCLGANGTWVWEAQGLGPLAVASRRPVAVSSKQSEQQLFLRG